MARWKGLLLCACIAVAATALGRVGWLRDHGVGALTIAIVVGMVTGNAAYPRAQGLARECGVGIDTARQTLLRLGVILYGFRLTLQDVGTFGISGVLIDAAVLVSTFVFSTFAGTRWLGMDRKSAMLIATGSSICGAAAIMAAEPVVRARAEQVTIAVATVVVFGTIAIFLYPTLFALNAHLNFLAQGDGAFGIYVGSTVHEVAQVVATARSIGPNAADTAVIAKMVRVMMLAPFLLGLSAWLSFDRCGAGDRGFGPAWRRSTPLAMPWFPLGFVAIVIFNSLHILNADAQEFAWSLDNLLLAMAMAALGISTRIGSIRQAGARPLLLALLSFCWLVVVGAAINRWVPAAIAGIG
jgi:uncharacterized integral membrane protein (TIGR00698 family)